MSVPRHVIEIDDLEPAEITEVLDLSEAPARPPLLRGQTVGLIFEKPSTRTRNSVEAAVIQLGGHPITMQANEVGFGERESPADVARVLSRYHAAIGARVNEQTTIRVMAAVAEVPVINLLSDRSHPCQALADLLTLRQRWGALAGRTLTWIGDGNNVCRSLALGAAAMGMNLKLAWPPGYGLTAGDLEMARTHGTSVEIFDNPQAAAHRTDCIATDVWSSMGREAERDLRNRAFAGWTVDERMMFTAGAEAVFLHCLPAHRGEEVSPGVIDGPRSLVWQQAENRMHTARGLLRFLLS